MAEKKIHGSVYQVGTMLALDALKLKVKLLKVLGGAIDRLPMILAGAGKDKDKAAKDASNAAAVAAFADIFVHGDPDEMIALVKEIAEMAQVKRPSGAWEQVDVELFQSDDLSELFEIVVFVLREVFGPFFSEILANSKVKKAMEA